MKNTPKNLTFIIFLVKILRLLLKTDCDLMENIKLLEFDNFSRENSLVTMRNQKQTLQFDGKKCF